jgi:cytochrome c biogenesis protein CcdA
MDQHEIFMEALRHVAQLCAVAAMAAPKSGGQLFLKGSKPFIETVIVEDRSTLSSLAYWLRERGRKLKAPIWFRDADTTENSTWCYSLVCRSNVRPYMTAVLVGGFLIGLCTVPCSGAVYLGVLSLLALQPTHLLGYSYLVLYNLVFILPLVIILVLAAARPTLNRLAHWNLHHKEWVRLVLGGGVVMMGVLILATV